MTEIIETPSLRDLLANEPSRQAILNHLDREDVCLIRQVVAPVEIRQFIEYLTGIGRGSLPNWHAISAKCPNHHRVNRWDERSYVKACFHQFSFFPWNHDVFDFFRKFRDVFALRNLLGGADPDAFLGHEPSGSCTARLSFQFYPSGGGAMNAHIDPSGPHQAAVPTLTMSDFGRDFQEGGAFMRNSQGEVTWIERYAKAGDVVLFSPKLVHGVAPIDPAKQLHWSRFEGRWMSIFAVNKLAENTTIADAIDVTAHQPGTGRCG